MTHLRAHGIAVTTPPGWEGRVYRRPAAGQANAPGAAAAAGAPAPPGETTNTVVQVATIALPPDAGDFASDAVENLGNNDALVVLFEYDPSSVDQPLFADHGMLRSLQPDDFSPNVLQRTLRGQAGAQMFFQDSGRAFCLYVVLGSFTNRGRLVHAVNDVLASFEIGSTAPSGGRSVLDVVGSEGDLTVLADLLASGHAHDLLAGDGPFTLFAPTDDAWAAIDLAALRTDQELLTRTLEHHVVRGRIPFDEFEQRPTLDTVEGHAITVRVTGMRATVEDIAVVRPDLDATNGVVHVITGVLEVPR
jgi:uncharacterized surface protein with fasciclin (FAS1) repeats